MSVETELEAIRTGAAIYPLTDRAFLRITGSDAIRWLNGMVTNSIQSLQPGEGNYNFLLNAQGRIQGDCMVYRDLGDEPTFLLETDSTQIDTIQQLLDKFIIMDDVELTPIEMDGIGIVGKAAHRFCVELGLPYPDFQADYPVASSTTGKMFRSFLNNGSKLTLFPPLSSTFEIEIWSTDPNEIRVSKIALQQNGTTQLSPEAIEAHRILTATPKYGVDIRNTETHKDLPQETAQTHALHFNKGCYLGQEIVERIRSRGQIHRTFTAFTLTPEGESNALPTLPAPLEATIAGQTRPAGELTSAMRIGDTIHALGYLRREFATHPLTYPGGTAKPALSPHETLNPAP